jgi:4,5-dihydroxyphthalate decarboxylase
MPGLDPGIHAHPCRRPLRDPWITGRRAWRAIGKLSAKPTGPVMTIWFGYRGKIMSLLPLTIATGNYDRVKPLADGRVGIEGCDVRFLPLPPEEAFYRAFTNKEFDVTELSASSYIIARSRGVTDYVAVPVFLSRLFRHSAIYIRADSGIKGPRDLIGREVGVPVYAMTASLWVRGMLEEQHGVPPSAITWRTGGLEEPGRYGKFPLNLPPDIKVEPIPTDRSLSDMLAKGELTALVSAREPSCYKGGSGEIRRMFPDYKTEEMAYYRQTGLFPIMHLLGIRQDVVDKNPWLPSSVLKAFTQAKDIATHELNDVTALNVSMPWLVADLEQTKALMGEDFWRYGFKNNLKELEVMCRWSHRQGLAARPIKPEELFHPATLEQARV